MSQQLMSIHFDPVLLASLAGRSNDLFLLYANVARFIDKERDNLEGPSEIPLHEDTGGLESWNLPSVRRVDSSRLG